jgi:hypothetical protein
MNPDTTPTPRTDAARTLIPNDITFDWVHYTICGKLESELTDKTNEVARLRELLNRAIEILTAITWGDEGRDYDWQRVIKDLEKIKKEAQLAPVPEEPVNQCRCNNPSIITATHNGKTYEQCSKCGKKFGITLDEWYGGFSKIQST